MNRLGLIALHLILLSVLCSGCAKDRNITAIELSENWQCRWGQNSETNTNSWFRVDYLHAFDNRSGNLIWCKNTLPDVKIENPMLYLPRVTLSLKILIGVQSVYEHGEFAAGKASKYSSLKSHIVPIKTEFRNQVIHIGIFSDSASKLGIDDSVNPVILSQGMHFMSLVVPRNIGRVLLALLFHLLGVLSLILFFMRLKARNYDYLIFGLFTFSIGTFFLFVNALSVIALNNPQVSYYGMVVGFLMFPVFMFAFFERTIQNKAMRSLWAAHLVFALVSIALDALGHADTGSIFPYFSVLFLISIVASLLMGAQAAYGGSKEARLFVIGFAFAALTGVADLLTGLHIIPHWGWSSPYGLPIPWRAPTA